MKFFASAYKELLILVRDRGGLAIIFLMPLALACIVTMIQDKAFQSVSESTVSLALVNRDAGAIGRGIAEKLAESGDFFLVTTHKGVALDEGAARGLVTRGAAQVCVVIPEDASAHFEQRLRAEIEKAFAEEELAEDDAAWKGDEPPKEKGALCVEVCFDPAVGSLYRKSVFHALQRLTQGVEMGLTVNALGNAFRKKIDALAAEMSGEAPEDNGDLVDLSGRAWADEALLPMREVYLEGGREPIVPTPVQQNVPAWTLFAMFLIVVPLSSSLIQERQQGTLTRLRTLPVRPFVLFAGKQAVYLGVCAVQFAMMLLIGVAVMPLLGMSSFDPGSHYVAMVSVCAASGLAATGLGLVISVFARSNEQAAMFGATIVVIASALGGIMVPTFLMPAALQQVSAFSPMNWGLNAFLGIFVRQYGFWDVLPDVLKLLAFFGVTLFVSLFYTARRPE